uniref:SPRY domain containing 3 n=2 Tax=Accipitrinae TaxID=8955 RepID=A0A8B9N0I3_9AVES
MDDLNLHYRFLNWRRRIREIREVRAVRYQERAKHILVDGDTLSYHGNSGEVGCYVAPRPLTRDNNYFEVSIVDSGVRGTIAVGLVPQYYSLDHQPGWLPDSVAYHADDGKLYSGRAKGRQFGTKCSSGDRIGCGIELVSFEVQTAQIFFTKNGKRVGSTIMPLSPEGLFPAVGMHSLGEEVRLHLHAELGTEEDDSAMMVDSYEEEWGRLHDVKVCGTVSAAPHPQVRGGVGGGGPLEELPPPPPSPYARPRHPPALLMGDQGGYVVVVTTTRPGFPSVGTKPFLGGVGI